MNWLFIFLSAILIYWAVVLIVASFEMDDPRIFWTQRLLAFIVLFGAIGVINASP